MNGQKIRIPFVIINKAGFFAIILFMFMCLAGRVLAQDTQVYTPQLDSAYKLLEKKDLKNAIPLFEDHIKLYPQDTRVWMQLAYIYDETGNYSKSYQYFSYVAKNSKDAKEKEQAEVSAAVMKDKLNRYAKRTVELNVASFYDTYQQNYITGLDLYYRFLLSKEVYVGPYMDVYTDSKSTPGNIYNDRYIELGLFARFYALPFWYFELRTGYVHEFDLDSSKINVSPRMVFGYSLGSATDYITDNAKVKHGFFADFYTVFSYENKYRNGFNQTSLMEGYRKNIVGYSHIDLYLKQQATFDSRRLDYNNNLTVGGGLRYKPNLIFFPYFFIEPSYKYYLISDPTTGIKRTGSFQIQAGISFSVIIKG